ncbi:flagellar motor switch protein FliG [Parasporobacterium paucivorans]|uniref:Flagellar motor switch protein FliG n=1 Tax=Parasporobacterium paucivorans DSM 15970 TaxID=1122934 RepID=A0A1M6I7R2_9FIRM|nr:flagellar motor switch protein FliG [Parasporobacterium paucivorans]SHJ30436.1 flagellar motor switch protein FliG [Parasporobacterium paucivorans DSM 15970]
MSSLRGLTPGQKAAAVVVSLGVDKASQIYKFMDKADVEKLTLEVARLGHLEADETEGVLDEFYKTCLTQKVVTDGGLEYARTVLEKAFGESQASTLLDKVTKSLKTKSFGFIRKNDVKSLFLVLQHERAQTIALVLAYTDPEMTASLIEELPRAKRLQVVECIARMESASPEAIKIVEEQLKRKFSSILTTDYTTIGGIDYIADVMNRMDRSNEKLIFDELGRKDAELTDTIRKKMFVFEDIIAMDDRSIQRFIRECDPKDIVYALKNANEQVSGMFFANMSARMAETIQADLEVTVNVRLRDVEEAQQKIVNTIRRLEEEGELIINKGGKEEIIG